MRSVMMLLFVMQGCIQETPSSNRNFSIKILDFDYSLAYTTQYTINQDSVMVTGVSGVQGEKDKILLNRKIKEKERQRLSAFLSSFPIDSLSNKYTDSLVEDGNQKRVEVAFENKQKTIDLENFYQEDMSRLFKVVNSVLEGKMQIKYSK